MLPDSGVHKLAGTTPWNGISISSLATVRFPTSDLNWMPLSGTIKELPAFLKELMITTGRKMGH
jgi:hypothetical protein